MCRVPYEIRLKDMMSSLLSPPLGLIDGKILDLFVYQSRGKTDCLGGEVGISPNGKMLTPGTTTVSHSMLTL